MAERTEREGYSPVSAEFLQDAEATQRPATPVYRRGYYFDDDHDHHEKKSVLAKVKDKAKKWKNILAKKKQATEGDSPRSWSSALDEVDEEEGDPEYHGAPMYESEMAPRAYKDMGTHHHATAQSLNPLALHRGKSPNQLSTLLNDHQEPTLYHLNAIKETPDNHIAVSDALEASPKYENSMEERSSNSAYHHQVSDTMAGTKNEGSIKERKINRASHPLSRRTHQLRANTKQTDANDSIHEFLDPNILQANTRYDTNHPFSDTHLLVGKHTNPTNKANHPVVSSSTHLLMGNKEHGFPTNDNISNKIYHSTFSDSQLLVPNRHHGDLIKKSSSSTKNHAFSGEYLPKASNEGTIKKRDIRSGNQPILSGTIRLNDHASPRTPLSRSKPTESIKENGSNKGKRNNEEPIESFNKNLYHPAISNANHLLAKTNCEDCNYGSDSNKTLITKVSEMLAPAYAIVSDLSHMIALNILCPTDGDEIGALQAHDPVKELTETISNMFTQAHSMVSDASLRIASKTNGPTEGDDIRAQVALEPLTRSSRNKTITETMSQMLNTACSVVSDGSHKTTTKNHGSAVRDVTGAKLALEPLTKSSGNKNFTETMSEMLNAACSMVSGSSQKMAPMIHGSEVTDKIGAKVALEPLTESSSSNKTLTETMSGILAPAYTVVSDASQKIASKIQGPSALDEIVGKMAHDPIVTRKPLTYTMSETLSSVQTEKEGKQAWDKGVSVKEYLRNTLSPGEEDRALSQVITESMSPSRTVPLAEGSLVEKVRAAISSHLEKEGHSRLTTVVPSVLEVKKEPTAGLILPVSTNPRTVEIEEIDVKRVPAYIK